jgi:hypothetical protein
MRLLKTGVPWRWGTSVGGRTDNGRWWLLIRFGVTRRVRRREFPRVILGRGRFRLMRENEGPAKSNFPNWGGDPNNLAALGEGIQHIPNIDPVFLIRKSPHHRLETPHGLIDSQFVLLSFLPAAGEK